jgi:polyribonucleotide nucleotidyltransferase
MDNMEDDKYCEWKVKEAAETLVRAEEIKKDKEMLALVKAELEKSSQAIKSIKELRGIASKKMAEREEEEESDEDGIEEDKELRTEEDKAALQVKAKVDKNLEKFKK